MVKFRASFWDFIKDPIASALLFTLFTLCFKPTWAAIIFEFCISQTVLLQHLFLFRLNLCIQYRSRIQDCCNVWDGALYDNI